MGRVSGNGWAIGSFGGILCLLIILPPIILVEGTIMVRLDLVFTALFFALSTIPALRWIKERAEAQQLPRGENYVTLGFKRIGITLKSIRHYREFIKFVLAFLIYNDGILMALDFAAIIGAVLFGMDQQQLILFMILVQVTSVIGAYLFGLVGDRIGFKRSLVISILLMTAIVGAMLFTDTLAGYFVIGAFAGFALTGVQSLSRTMVGLFAPEGQSAEFFGFFAIAGRTSSFIGPTIYGFVAAEAALWFEANRGMAVLPAEQAGQRVAILSIAIFLLVGLTILVSVSEAKARRAATTPVPVIGD